MTITRDVLKTFWQYSRPYMRSVVIIVAFVSMANAAEALVPWFFKKLFDLLEQQSPTTSNMQLFLPTILIMIGLNGLGWLCWRLTAYFNNRFQPKVKADLEENAFSYLLGHSLGFFANSFTGALVKRVGRLSSGFERVADELTFRVIPIIVALIGAIVGLSIQMPLLAIGFIIWTVIFIFFNYLVSKWTLKTDTEQSRLDSESGAALADAISNATTVKLFPANNYEIGRFRTALNNVARAETRSWDRHEFVFSVQGFLMIGINVAFLYIAVQFWLNGIFTLGDIAFIQTYLIYAFSKLWEIGRSFRQVFHAVADAKEMVTIMQMPHEIRDRRGAKAIKVKQGAIAFKHVFFRYGKTRQVLDGFDLKIRPREKVALVGPSGAGKSTVVKLILRFHDIQKGKILIDSQNINAVTQDSLREAVAMVPQDPVLFHRSLLDNIRYGRREASDQEVIEAAKKAHCHEFISQLPDGYGTFVGERGIKLSGGERQRVAIARAILKDAPILILDEATSSLDSESEQLIQAALAELMKNKTTIVIAHRLSTILKMDRIVVVSGGKVVDQGTHTTLIKKTGIYKTLWEIQAGGFIQ